MMISKVKLTRPKRKVYLKIKLASTPAYIFPKQFSNFGNERIMFTLQRLLFLYYQFSNNSATFSSSLLISICCGHTFSHAPQPTHCDAFAYLSA